MDSRPVPPEFMTAGSDYLASIRKLGLEPVYLGWGWERDALRWVLVLVTSIIDAGGPVALNELLIRAYNAEATPKEISPFIVRVLSPEIMRLQQLELLQSPELRINSVNNDPRDILIANAKITHLGIDFERINSYKATGRPLPKYSAKQEAWRRFKRQVDRLAA